MSRRRTSVVLVLGLLVLVGAGVYGQALFRHDRAEAEDAAATWDDYRVARSGLVIHATRGGCQEVVDVDVSEGGTRVEITLELSGYTDGCDEDPADLARRVELASPLRDREVYDGGCLTAGGSDAECRREAVPAGR